MKILGIIPSRYSSTRFPAKALADIAGKSMIQRTYEQAKQCELLNDVIVATDHQEIFDCVNRFDGQACMTKSTHQSGTDRCYEALHVQANKYDYVINIQGDEPFINPEQITQLAHLLDGKTQLATLVKTIDHKEDIFNPNVVKVIFNQSNEAIYFSRNPIPFGRNFSQDEWHNNHTYHKHIGIYAYRTDILKQITKLPTSSLENAESLEQLRWVENGYKIKIATTEFETIGIDTPEDLDKALKIMKMES
ncbi:MAG: 3-deoxy-manno-octulosonate cytidylyltransferase [Cyclobacteriaceae bacterium]|nr:3-deoxy-manno-octulosonate cytidylyltransferase [Cyclobacteriaceae bacterium]